MTRQKRAPQATHRSPRLLFCLGLGSVGLRPAFLRPGNHPGLRLGADNPLGLLSGRNSNRSSDRTILALLLCPPGLMGSTHLGLRCSAHGALGFLRRRGRSGSRNRNCRAALLRSPPGLLRRFHLGPGGSAEGPLALGSCRWCRSCWCCCCSHGHRIILTERLGDLTQSGFKLRLLVQQGSFEGEVFVNVSHRQTTL